MNSFIRQDLYNDLLEFHVLREYKAIIPQETLIECKDKAWELYRSDPVFYCQVRQVVGEVSAIVSKYLTAEDNV